MALDLAGLDRLEAAIAAQLPRGAVAVATDPRAERDGCDVFAAEAAAVARAVPRRRAEFFAGRVAAHRAMSALGLLPAPVPMGADRAPVWPKGLRGSISHCDGGCVALLAREGDFAAVAIDLERDEDLPGEVEPMVCLPQERAWLDSLPVQARGRAARRIFCAKEAAYKLQYPLTGKMLDFSAVQITMDLATGRFSARFSEPFGRFSPQDPIEGRTGREAGFIYCMMFIPQAAEI